MGGRKRHEGRVMKRKRKYIARKEKRIVEWEKWERGKDGERRRHD